MNTIKHIACVTALIGWAVGCTPVQRDGDLMVRDFSVADQTQLSDLLETCEDVLRDQGFRIDRVDRRAGVVTTYPETSKHFFEVWRKDVATSYDFWEASLNTIRRSVEIQAEPDLAKGETRMTLKVKRERFSAPDRQFNNSIAAFQFYGDALPSVSTGERVTRADVEWIEDGRDLAMEELLINKIAARAG
ncbi:MAG: hypothetical protein DHS20C16_25660 [Phycisphaerae bacterium]|nr:MAG: hypothetical protein DHS20C16_25660 [Phycisphaerae bacterium]